MASMASIPNLIYSNNPFLVKKLFEIIDDKNKDIVRKTVLNVKYWYASMPEECKKILHKIIEGETFSIFNGTYISNVEYSHRMSSLYYGLYTTSNTGVDPHEARSYSEALNRKSLKSPKCPRGEEYSLIDHKNNFTFLVTTKEITLIDEFGSEIMKLNESDKHALLIYGTIRGVQQVKDNIAAWELMRYKETLKDKILELYDEPIQKKEA